MSSVTFHICLDIRRDDDGDDYNEGESSDKDYYEENDDEQHAITMWR